MARSFATAAFPFLLCHNLVHSTTWRLVARPCWLPCDCISGPGERTYGLGDLVSCREPASGREREGESGNAVVPLTGNERSNLRERAPLDLLVSLCFSSFVLGLRPLDRGVGSTDDGRTGCERGRVEKRRGERDVLSCAADARAPLQTCDRGPVSAAGAASCTCCYISLRLSGVRGRSRSRPEIKLKNMGRVDRSSCAVLGSADLYLTLMERSPHFCA